MSADLTRAVFLSYASQDSEAAKRICEALRNTGIEVWFDQSELRGGDAWDAKIRRQIKECALFVPIISANTQARAEGYFRLEWRLADQRTHLMGKSKAFLMPVCIDGTHDANADVPDSFLAVQWTRLSGGESNEAFCDRVKRLLAGDAGRGLPTLPPDGTFVKSAGVGVDPSLPKPILTLTAQRSMVALAAVAALVALALWQPWRRTGKKLRSQHRPPAARRIPPSWPGRAPAFSRTAGRSRISMPCPSHSTG